MWCLGARCSCEVEGLQSRFRVAARHERLPDENGVCAGVAVATHVSWLEDRRFGDLDDIVRVEGSKLPEELGVELEGREVASVDAEDPCAGVETAQQLVLRMRL